jgi:hypothetical protein
MRTCEVLGKDFYLCGLTTDNRRAFAESGLLDASRHSNFYSNTATMLQSVCKISAVLESKIDLIDPACRTMRLARRRAAVHR